MKKLITLIAVLLFAPLLYGQIQPTDTDGDGYYNISTLDHLRWISENPSSWSWNFELDNDIDATDTKNWNIGDHDNDSSTPDSAMGWSPIGNINSKYRGDFDGHNYIISNVFINRLGYYYIGFFGAFYQSNILNLKLTDVKITGKGNVGGFCGYSDGGSIGDSYIAGSILGSGGSNVGGFCGRNYHSSIINSYSTVSISGSSSNVGGLCGILYKGRIINSYSKGNISITRNSIGGICGKNDEGSILNCYNIGTVLGGGSHVGGICGDNDEGSILNCYNIGTISGNFGRVGGICGNNDKGTISNSYSIGSVTAVEDIGGLCGYNFQASIINSYSTGSVSGTGNRIGGLCGNNDEGSISNSYSTGTVSGNLDTGGFLGKDFRSNGSFSGNFWDTQTSGLTTSATGTGKITAEMKTQSTFTNWDFTNVWGIYASINSGYPILKKLYKGTLPEAPTDTDGDGYYNISTLSHLRWISENDSSWTWNFELDNDIDASDTKNWNVGDHDNDASTPDSAMGWSPIGVSLANPYSGKFNGQGYKIDSLYINRPGMYNVGFWGYIYQSDVTNLKLTNIQITGDDYIGGFCGKSYSSNVSNSSVSGNIVGDNFVGGICGYGNKFYISNVSSLINVISTDFTGGLCGKLWEGSISNSYFVGNITGDDYVGGLCGNNIEVSISNSHSLGDVSGSGICIGGLCGESDEVSIISSYSSCNVEGYHSVGGLCGKNNKVRISNSYSLGDVTGEDYIGGLCGDNDNGSIMNSYSTGYVSGTGSGIGGFLGRDNNGTFSGNFWDTQTSDQISSAAGSGKTTAEMKTQSTFTNWDFTNIWGISPSKNDGYPYLRDTVIHKISLKSGWNFISSYLLPADSNIVNIFADIQNDFLLARGENSTIYFPNLQLNSIGNWNFKKGYNVYMTKDTTLSITGIPAPSNSTIDLKQGWNMVSFLMSEETDITTALAGIANDLLIVKDSAGNIYFPNLNINNIGTMKPGEGYYIYMKNAATLDYP